MCVSADVHSAGPSSIDCRCLAKLNDHSAAGMFSNAVLEMPGPLMPHVNVVIAALNETVIDCSVGELTRACNEAAYKACSYEPEEMWSAEEFHQARRQAGRQENGWLGSV